MRLVKPYQVSSQTGPPKAAFGTMPFVLALFSHRQLPLFAFTGHYSLATRHYPSPSARPAGSGRAHTLPRWLLPDTDRRIDKDRAEPDLDDRPLSIQYVTESGDPFGKIKLFLATRR